jgi:hypothetical protein
MRLSKIVALTFVFILFGCSSTQVIKDAGAVRLELKGQPGQVDITRYYSHSYIEDFEGDQKVRQRDEIVDFKVKESVTKVDAKSGHISVKATTISKDGTVDLHDLAFPEKGEEIAYVFSRQGEVYRAGEYSPDSVFYVPPVPLPKTAVQVGDTWTLDHAWVGMKNGIPLGVHLVAILKNIVRCGKDRCADVEVSGGVEVIGLPSQRGQFRSQIWGRMWISIERGAVVWSEMRSRERMDVPSARSEVLSCMSAMLDEGKNWNLPSMAKLVCKPTAEPFKM